MMRVFRAEWLRLRQPLLLGGSTAGVAGFGVLITAVTFLLIERNGTTRGFNNRLLGAEDFAGPDGFALLLSGRFRIGERRYSLRALLKPCYP
jgi:hypothetical protein